MLIWLSIMCHFVSLINSPSLEVFFSLIINNYSINSNLISAHIILRILANSLSFPKALLSRLFVTCFHRSVTFQEMSLSMPLSQHCAGRMSYLRNPHGNPPFLCLVTTARDLSFQDSSVIGCLPIGPLVSGSNPFTAQLSLRVRRVASSLYVIPGVGITRYGHIERKDLDATRYARCFSVSKCLPFTPQ